MQTECIPDIFGFEAVEGRQVVAAFDGGAITSDAGALLLGGTEPQGGEEHLLGVLKEARSHKEAPDPRLPLFFTSSAASQAAGLAFLKRASGRTTDRDPESGEAVTTQQAKALIGWCDKDPSEQDP